MTEENCVYIIGSGISGLGCSHFLKKQGYSSIIFERQGRIGGRAGCVNHHGRKLELGGKNFASNWPYFNQILQDFHISVFDSQHPNFTILLNNELMTFSKKIKLSELPGLVKGIGINGCYQFLKFLQWVKKNDARLKYDSPYLQDIEEQYDDHTIDRYFSTGLVQGPLRMFSIIMGGAEPEETYYSTLSALLSGFGKGSHHSLADSIGILFNRLGENQQIHYHSNVTEIKIKNQRVNGIVVQNNGSQNFIPAQKVICATPAHSLPKLIDLSAEAKEAISRIRYFPVVLINAEYEQDVFNDQCVSIMFDKRFHLGHCSANRLYQKNRIRFTFTGKRARNVINRSDEELIALAEKEFSSVWPISSRRLFYHVQRHTGGICAYGPHYTKTRQKVLQFIDSVEGLEISGDYLMGHNMEHCLCSAYMAAQNIIRC